MNLKSLIREEIIKKGYIPFDEFVSLVLFHPELGYYVKKRVSPLPGEDFITAPELSPSFGRLLAYHIGKVAKKKGIPLRILELGGGKGFLAKEILSFLPVEDYVILEVNDVAEKLVGGVKVIKTLEELDEFEGFVISNEFFDAFPFKRIKKVKGKLYEIVVKMDKNGNFKEGLLESFLEIPCEPEEGCEYSFFRKWEEFLPRLFRKLRRGYFLTIDYGDECINLKNRKEGTFLAFRNNKVESNYFDFIGEVDLTSRVDFSYLRNLLSKYLERVSVKPLSEFLLSEGIERFLLPSNVLEAFTLIVDMGRKYKVLSGFRELC